MERLQKVIANSGYTSRRKAEELILAGKVTVNGKVIQELGYKVNSGDAITVENKQIQKSGKKVYYLLNKPRGVISSTKDEKNRKTVVDLIETDERIYPIGRLDYDTTGVLLLTNDGDFANLLMHPKNNVEKIYLAKINGILDKDSIDKLKKGIVIDNKKVDFEFKVRKKNTKKNNSMIEIRIKEGRNHIVKNIFLSIGYKVEKLTRTSYGNLTVGNLNPGEYRELTAKEIKRFYQ